MTGKRIAILTAVSALALLSFVARAPAHGGVRIGIGIGLPLYFPWGPCCGYYPYQPVYVAPAPVYVPTPVYVQPAAVVQPVPAARTAYQTPAPPTAIAQTVASDGTDRDADRYLQLLRDPDERTRAESAIQLGRMKSARAVDPLAATLAGDRSAVVREAAARALALVGSRSALTALEQAALADSDRDVRHSAQFAIEVIQSR
jgi:HEAT repeats